MYNKTYSVTLPISLANSLDQYLAKVNMTADSFFAQISSDFLKLTEDVAVKPETETKVEETAKPETKTVEENVSSETEEKKDEPTA